MTNGSFSDPPKFPRHPDQCARDGCSGLVEEDELQEYGTCNTCGATYGRGPLNEWQLQE